MNLVDRTRSLRWLAGRIEVFQVRRFGASALSLVFGTPVLVLDTIGRRSGLVRATPLAYRREADGSLLVVGGAAGQTRTPGWVLNLRARPDAVVTIGRIRMAVRAEELVGADRATVWAELRTVWPRIDRYERRAGRLVPVFRFVALDATSTRRDRDADAPWS